MLASIQESLYPGTVLQHIQYELTELLAAFWLTRTTYRGHSCIQKAQLPYYSHIQHTYHTFTFHFDYVLVPVLTSLFLLLLHPFVALFPFSLANHDYSLFEAPSHAAVLAHVGVRRLPGGLRRLVGHLGHGRGRGHAQGEEVEEEEGTEIEQQRKEI